MRARLIATEEASERDIGAWRDLAGRALEPNPFFEPDFVLPAARRRDQRGVGLLIAEDENGWVACLPVRPRRWRSLPVPALGAWCHSHCFLGTPLIAAGATDAALGA